MAALAVCGAGALGAAWPAPEPSRPMATRAGLVLGGARAVALDLLWLQTELRRQQGYTLELPARYRAITALDPRNARAFEHHADVLLGNLPLAAAGDPEAGWRFAREGFELLQTGRAANPDDEGLARALAYHLWWCTAGERPPEWRARVREAFGRDPLEWAGALAREWHARPDHHGLTDAVLVLVCDARADELDGPEAEALRAEAGRLRAHIRTAHGMDLRGDDVFGDTHER